MNKKPNQMQRIMIAMEKAGAVRRDGKSTAAELGVTPRGLPAKLKPFWEFAVEHSAADHRCGRTWQCACGPCGVIRKEIKRRNNMEPNRGNAWMLGHELMRALGEGK